MPKRVAALVIALSFVVPPAVARLVHHHQTNPYRCVGQQVWFYDWHKGSDGNGGYGFWDDDVKVCQRGSVFVDRWTTWKRNQRREK